MNVWVPEEASRVKLEQLSTTTEQSCCQSFSQYCWLVDGQNIYKDVTSRQASIIWISCKHQTLLRNYVLDNGPGPTWTKMNIQGSRLQATHGQFGGGNSVLVKSRNYRLVLKSWFLKKNKRQPIWMGQLEVHILGTHLLNQELYLQGPESWVLPSFLSGSRVT